MPALRLAASARSDDRRVDDARALVGRLGEGGQARVEVLGALRRAIRQHGPVAVEGADRLRWRRASPERRWFEHRRDPLRVIAHLVLEFRPVGVEPLTEVLHRRDDLVLEPFDADAERTGDVLDAASQRRVDVLGERRQRLRQLAGALLQASRRFPPTWRPCLERVRDRLRRARERFRACCARASPTARGRAGRGRPRCARAGSRATSRPG